MKLPTEPYLFGDTNIYIRNKWKMWTNSSELPMYQKC